MIKMVNFIRILSITLYLGVLGLVYAYLPVMVRTLPQDDTILVHREYSTCKYRYVHTVINNNYRYDKRVLLVEYGTYLYCLMSRR